MKVKIPISIINFIEDKKIEPTITELKLTTLLISEFNKKYFDDISKDKKQKIDLLGQEIYVEISKKDITKYVGTIRRNKFIEILCKQKTLTSYDENTKSYIFNINKTFVRYLILENKGFIITTDKIFDLKHKISFLLLLISKKYNKLLLSIDKFKELILEQETKTQHIKEKINLSIKEIKEELNTEIKIELLNKINNPVSRGEKAEKVFIQNKMVYEFEIYTKMTIQELKDLRLIPLQCDDILYKLKKEYGNFELLMFLLSIKDKTTRKITNIEKVCRYTIDNHLNNMSEIGLYDFKKRKEFFYKLSEECKEWHKKAVLKNKRVREGSNEELDFYEYYYSVLEIEEKLLGKTIDGDSLLYINDFNKLMKTGKEYIKEMPFGRMNLIFKKEGVSKNVVSIPTRNRESKNNFKSAI